METMKFFGGYNRYLVADKIYYIIIKNKLLSFLISKSLSSLLKNLGRMPSRFAMLGDKLLKLQTIVNNSSGSKIDLYKQIISSNHAPLVIAGTDVDALEGRYLSDLINCLTFKE